MSKFTQKYTVICSIEELEVGYEFEPRDWPLHVTLAETFSIKWSSKKLLYELSKLAAKTNQITTTAVGDEYFGPNQDVHVTIVDMTEDIIKLHNEIVVLLKEGGVAFNDPQYTETGYRAHAKVQRHARLQKADTINFTNIILIDMFPGGNPYKRKVLGAYKLKDVQQNIT